MNSYNFKVNHLIRIISTNQFGIITRTHILGNSCKDGLIVKLDNNEKKVISINVAPNEQLNNLYMVISKLTYEIFGTLSIEFNPHVTIVHRDLKPESFEEAWHEFANGNFNYSFRNNSISLLVYRDGKWKVESELKYR